MGHAIIGCDLYSDKQLGEIDNSEQMAERLMLHATTLEFDHPVTGERILAKVPCPF